MNYFKHFCTVSKHKWLVFIHCIRAGIPFRGLLHDLSKFSPTEFLPSVKYYTGINSPIANERKSKGYSYAWIHHKSHNKHHVEYWYDINIRTGEVIPVIIPPVYMKEMFCDMLAANKVYKGKKHTDSDAIEYFHNNRMNEHMHEKSAEFLKSCFIVLAEQGEKGAFKYLKKAAKDYAKEYHSQN